MRIRLLPPLAALALAACAAAPDHPAPDSHAPLVTPNHDPLAAIRAAGAREESVIDVTPLRDPGIAAWQDAAHADERAGRYAEAAAKLDRALEYNPESPELLQDRAEIAVRLKDYATAERLALRSWSLGPKLGPLCARNWQTVVEMRELAGDTAGAATALQWVARCHVPGVPRY